MTPHPDPFGLLGVVMGTPFDRRTWSGASHHLFSALRRHGVLSGVVDATPPAPGRLAARALAVSPSRHRWRERHEYSPVTRELAARHAARSLARIDPSPDVLLQVGAYYDFSPRRAVRPRLRCSFHDANLALYTRADVFVEDADAPHVRSMMRHEKRTLDGLDLVMTMSQWLASSFVRDFDQDPAKVVVVGSGVNNPRVPPPPERDWATPRLLFVGYDWRRKGLPLVRDAYLRLQRDHPGATLTVVGPPPQQDLSAPGIEWTGLIDRSTPEGDAQLQRIHQRSTALVLMPSYDPMPNVVLEAMAHGLPVVAPRQGSMPEMVPDGECGVLVDDHETASLAAALDTLARRPELARQMGAAGRARVLEHFTWDRVAANMVAAMGDRLTC